MKESNSKANYLEIDRSQVIKSIIAGGIVVLLICLLVTILLGSLFNYSNRIETLTLTILWIGMPALWAIGSLGAWINSGKNSYILTKDSLIIRKKALTGTSETYYRYDSFLTIEVRQKAFSNKSGKIVINIPKMPEPLVLEYIKNPRDQAEKLKKHITKRSADTKSLIN